MFEYDWDFPGIQNEILFWAYGDEWYWNVEDYIEVWEGHTEKTRTREQMYLLWAWTH